MPELRLDLHMHSDRSDGRHPPDEVLARCAAGGLDVIALTDHDLAPALRPGTHEVGGRTIRVVGAAEVSGVHEGRELHLLVYFPAEVPPTYGSFLTQCAAARAQRYDAAVGRLDVPLPPADPDAVAGRRALTRHHLARALVQSGRIRGVSDAWSLLSPGRVVPLIELPFLDAIRGAVAAGAFTSWAHPALADAQRHLRDFVAAGLHAVEADRPGLPRPTRNGLRRLAKQHRLMITGGSDWHGWWQGNLGDYAFTGEHAHAVLARLGAA